MTMQVNGTTGWTFADGSNQNTAASGFGFKNRIINGAMMIDQRNAGASVTTGFPVDRWKLDSNVGAKTTQQQNAGSVTPPVGFRNYLGVTSTSAYAVGASDIYVLDQLIEGYNVADLMWGTANAQPITISFWVRSSVTGTFGGSIVNNGATRSYPFTYTVNSANTWEYKSFTVAGDTSGTWLTTNGLGLGLYFNLGTGSTSSGTAGSWSSSAYYNATGSVNLIATNGATFYITGVQLEKGSTATSFDYRPYGTELALCQRYAKVMRGSAYTKYAAGTVGATTAVYALSIPFSIPMRASPSVSFSGTTVMTAGSSTFSVSTLNNLSSSDSACFDANLASGTFVVGQCAMIGNDAGGSSVLTISAEL